MHTIRFALNAIFLHRNKEKRNNFRNLQSFYCRPEQKRCDSVEFSIFVGEIYEYHFRRNFQFVNGHAIFI